MPKQLALIRGINVGGRMVSMARLRELIESAGYSGVKTHLQSGNVVFDARGATEDMCAPEIREMILEHFGHSVAVLIRDGADLRRIVAENPLRDVADNPARHLVEFLSSPPAADLVSSLDPAKFLPDLFALRGREVHIWYPDGVHGARLTHALLERRLGVSATARNWNTVTKLLSMME